VQDDPRSGRSKMQRTAENVGRVQTLVHSDRRLGERHGRRLQESIWRQRSELRPDNWILHHDNASEHDVLIVHKFLAKKSNTKMDHLPYSPDLTPWFLALSKIKKKNALKGQRFTEIPDNQSNVTLLWGIPKTDFQDYFWQWHYRLIKCIGSQGQYFEGDGSH
jgi:hypothetical protein